MVQFVSLSETFPEARSDQPAVKSGVKFLESRIGGESGLYTGRIHYNRSRRNSNAQVLALGIAGRLVGRQNSGGVQVVYKISLEGRIQASCNGNL